MKVLITAGGTAGHINPAIALAEKLESLGHDVIFAGTPNRLESTLIPQEGYKFKGFAANGFNRKKPWTLITALNSISKSTKVAKEWITKENPDVVIGFGCYVSLAICRAAKKLKIPYIVHEQNSVMGMANKYLSKNAAATCLAYKHADTGNCNNVIITGNPVRKKVVEATCDEGRKMLNIPADAEVLLVFGGSLGAQHINKAICDISQELIKRDNLYVVHVTGKNDYKNVLDRLDKNVLDSGRYKVLEYQNKMGETMAASNCCVSRSGASSLAEIAARCLPALLIPFPAATENHQFYNAQPWVEAGCAVLINDIDVGSKKFNDTVLKLIDDKKWQQSMVDAAKKQETVKAVDKLADVVLDIAGK